MLLLVRAWRCLFYAMRVPIILLLVRAGVLMEGCYLGGDIVEVCGADTCALQDAACKAHAHGDLRTWKRAEAILPLAKDPEPL
jgi:hypothetical protein